MRFVENKDTENAGNRKKVLGIVNMVDSDRLE